MIFLRRLLSPKRHSFCKRLIVLVCLLAASLALTTMSRAADLKDQEPSQWKKAMDNFKKVPPLVAGDEVTGANKKNAGQNQASTRPGGTVPPAPDEQGLHNGSSDGSGQQGTNGNTPNEQHGGSSNASWRNPLFCIALGMVLVATVYLFVRTRSRTGH